MEHPANPPPRSGAAGSDVERDVNKCVWNEKTQRYNRKGREDMRVLKLCLALGLVLAMGNVAFASTIPWSGGAWVAKLINWEASRVYTGYELDGSGNPTIPVTLGVAYTSGGTYDLDNLHYVDNAVMDGTETAYGVFKVTQVFSAFRTSPCTISPTSIQIWNSGDRDKEIWGVLGGRQDDQVIFSDPDNDADPQQYHQDIWSSSDRYDIYYQDDNLFSEVYPAGIPLTSGRIASTALDFKGIGFDGTGASTEGTRSELVLQGGSIQACNEDAEIVITDFDPAAFTTDLATHLLFDTGTPWNLTDDPLTDKDILITFPGPGLPPDPAVAHAKLTSTLENAFGLGGWDGTSEDPMDAESFVPEPTTLMAGFFGIAALGGYLRRRRIA